MTSDIVLAKVVLRRTDYLKVKANAEQLDGNVYKFEYGWGICECDRYAGEIAYLPMDTSYPKDAPTWIASGDHEIQGNQKIY
jgi:hypothetical protein